jgi:hypothetical protein
MKSIIFTNISKNNNIEQPKPASSFLPSWYKEMQSYVGGPKKPDGNGKNTATAKRCMPLFDSITAGYIITSAADVYVSIRNGGHWFEWPSLEMIAFHPIVQAPEHPAANGQSYPKWMNPWSIETPKGYSVLITQPVHRDLPFTILPGIVDTDRYTAPINFPFTMNDPLFEGVIPAGTPLAQVIPIKRDSWKMSFGDDLNIEKQDHITKSLFVRFFDGYRNMYWTKKEYK